MTKIFLEILSMSVTSAVVIGVIILLRIPLKKAPKIFSYILWTAALFRLLCPFTIELPTAPVAPVSFETSERNEYENSPNISESAPQTFDIKDDNKVIIYTSENDKVPVYKKTKKAVDIFAVVWTAGVTVMAAYGFVSYFRLKEKLRDAAKETDGIFRTDKINNPFIMGIIRPEIYLPANLSAEESRLIILHEKTHMKRLDHIAKIIMYAALCIHFFNPMVWVMFRLFERDMEMSCDESVTAKMTENEKADYSEALLNISIKPAAAFTACFGESGTKQRIRNVLNFKKPAVWVIIILTLAVTATAAALLANKQKENGLSEYFADRDKFLFMIQTDGEPELSAMYESLTADSLDALIGALENAEITPCELTASIFGNSKQSVGIKIIKDSSKPNDIIFVSLLDNGAEHYISARDASKDSGIYGKIKKSDAEKIISSANHTVSQFKVLPPVLYIGDPFSSQYLSGPVLSYSGASWEYTDENGKQSGFQADAISPLDENAHLPEVFLITGSCMTSFYTNGPDKIILSGWNADDIGNVNAKKTVFLEQNELSEPPVGILHLRKDTVYSLTAVWSEEKSAERGFSGSADYYFKTGSISNEPMIDVYGLSEERAVKLLEDAGYICKIVTKYSDVPKGKVIKTRPEKQTMTASNSEVTVYVSMGPMPKSPMNEMDYSIFSGAGIRRENGDTCFLIKFDSLAEAIKNAEYTRIDSFPYSDFESIETTEITFYVSESNYTSFSLWKSGGKCYLYILSTNSIYLFELSNDDYDNIMAECDKILKIDKDENEKKDTEVIPLTAVTEEWAKQIYFGSEFPYIVYADENYCVFTEGMGSLFLFDFGKKEITFSADIKETFDNAGFTGMGADSWNGVSFSVYRDDNGKLILGCSASFYKDFFSDEDKTLRFYIDTENYCLMPFTEKGYESSGKNIDYVRRISDSISDALSYNAASLSDGGYVYIANSGLNDHILPGEGSSLPMIEIVRKFDGREDRFIPFEYLANE